MSTVRRSVPAILALLLVPALASAEEPAAATSLHGQAETAMATTYVFRGIPQYLDKSDASSQTTLGLTLQDLGPGSLSIGLWNATAVTGYGDQPPTKLEFDLTVGYAFAVTSKLSAAAAYIGYFYPEASTVDGAHEVGGTLTWASELVTPSLGVFAEVVRLKGVYAVLSLGRDIPIGKIVLSPGASVAVSGYDAQPFGLNDAGLRLGAKWTAPSGLYLGGSANVSYNGVPDEASFEDRSTVWAMVFAGFAR